MKLESAFRNLGLPMTATPAEINSAFKLRARSAHRDQGGNDNAMRELIESKDIALEHSEATRTAFQLAVRTEIAQQMATIAKNADSRRRTSRIELAALKSGAATQKAAGTIAVAGFPLAAVTAVLSTIADKMLPNFAHVRVYGPILAALLTMCALISLAVWTVRRRHADDLANLVAELDDAEGFLCVLEECLIGGVKSDTWQRTDLLWHLDRQWLSVHEKTERVGPKLRRAFSRILGRKTRLQRLSSGRGAELIARLIIAKGIENGFLERELKQDTLNHIRYVYRVPMADTLPQSGD